MVKSVVQRAASARKRVRGWVGVCMRVCVCVLIKPHMWMFVAGWAHSSTHGLSWGPHRHRAGLDLSRDQCQQAHTGNTLHWCGACMAARILLVNGGGGVETKKIKWNCVGKGFPTSLTCMNFMCAFGRGVEGLY